MYTPIKSHKPDRYHLEETYLIDGQTFLVTQSKYAGRKSIDLWLDLLFSHYDLSEAGAQAAKAVIEAYAKRVHYAVVRSNQVMHWGNSIVLSCYPQDVADLTQQLVAIVANLENLTLRCPPPAQPAQPQPVQPATLADFAAEWDAKPPAERAEREYRRGYADGYLAAVQFFAGLPGHAALCARLERFVTHNELRRWQLCLDGCNRGEFPPRPDTQDQRSSE